MRENRKLTTKRGSMKSSVWKTLHASVKQKKQRAAAIARSQGMEFQSDVPNLSISRALIVLLVLHIIAIGGMFAHNKWFAETEQPVVIAEPVVEQKEEAKPAAVLPVAQTEPVIHTPTTNTGYELYVVSAHDTYEGIAEAKELDAYELRRINNNRQLRSGSVLRLPAKMVKPTITAAVAPASAPVVTPQPVRIEQAQVQPVANPVVIEESPAPVAVVVEEPEPQTGYRSHTVKKGDSLWRISRNFNVGLDALMSLNGISDPGTLQVGQTLKVPHS